MPLDLKSRSGHWKHSSFKRT